MPRQILRTLAIAGFVVAVLGFVVTLAMAGGVGWIWASRGLDPSGAALFIVVFGALLVASSALLVSRWRILRDTLRRASDAEATSSDLAGMQNDRWALLSKRLIQFVFAVCFLTFVATIVLQSLRN